MSIAASSDYGVKHRVVMQTLWLDLYLGPDDVTKKKEEKLQFKMAVVEPILPKTVN